MTRSIGAAQPLEAGENFFLRAGWLIDGLGGPAQHQVIMGVRGQLITEIAPYSPEKMNSPVIDFSKACLLPMLMDAHVHLALSGTTDPAERKRQLTFNRGQIGKAVIDHLEDYWRYGVCAVREAGDRHGAVWSNLRGRLISPTSPVATALTRWAWHAPGRYGAVLGRPPAPGLPLAEAAAPWLADMDHVKVIQSGLNSLDRFGEHSPPQFSQADLLALTTAAHRRGLAVMVHANGEAPIRSVICAGCDSLEHGYFMENETLFELAEHPLVWIPTLLPMAALAGSDQLTSRQRDTAQRTLDHQLEQVRRASNGGVCIGLGTDSGSLGVDHGCGVHQELALLMAAGLTPEQAVACGTAHIAKLLGHDHSGVLAPGYHASFLVVPEEPQRLLRGLSRIIATCWLGEWIPAAHAP